MTMLMCSEKTAACGDKVWRVLVFTLSELLGSVTRGTMNLVVSLCLLCLAGAGEGAGAGAGAGAVGTVSLYEYFTGEAGISSGLTATGQEFRLNGKEIKLLSGSLHYFRSPHHRVPQ